MKDHRLELSGEVNMAREHVRNAIHLLTAAESVLTQISPDRLTNDHYNQIISHKLVRMATDLALEAKHQISLTRLRTEKAWKNDEDPYKEEDAEHFSVNTSTGEPEEEAKFMPKGENEK